MSSRWLRLNVDWHLSSWLIVLSAESRLAWVQLLCHVKTHGLGGEAKVVPPQAAERMWFVNEPSIRQMLTAAEKSGALIIDNGKWVITKWKQYQGDDTNADRQRRYRERQRGAKSQQVRAKDVFERDGNACLKCGATENLVIDHVIPLAAGGDGTLENLQTLCRSCNEKKSDFVTGALRYGNDVTPTETETETETYKPPKPPYKGAEIPESLLGIVDSINQWVKYQRDRKTKPWVKETWERNFRKFADDPLRFKRAIEYSIEMGYQGLYEPKVQESQKSQFERLSS